MSNGKYVQLSCIIKLFAIDSIHVVTGLETCYVIAKRGVVMTACTECDCLSVSVVTCINTILTVYVVYSDRLIGLETSNVSRISHVSCL